MALASHRRLNSTAAKTLEAHTHDVSAYCTRPIPDRLGARGTTSELGTQGGGEACLPVGDEQRAWPTSTAQLGFSEGLTFSCWRFD